MYKEINNQHRSGRDFQLMDDIKEAIEYLKKHLATAIENGDRDEEGGAYGSLGNAYLSLSNYQKAIEYHEKQLNIATETGNRGREGKGYGSLGNAYHSLGTIESH